MYLSATVEIMVVLRMGEVALGLEEAVKAALAVATTAFPLLAEVCCGFSSRIVIDASKDVSRSLENWLDRQRNLFRTVVLVRTSFIWGTYFNCKPVLK